MSARTQRAVLVVGAFLLAVAAVTGYFVSDALAASSVVSPQLTSTPTAVTSERNASFAFTGPTGATFRCARDGASLATCTSPIVYSGLSLGSHSFRVIASVGTDTSDSTRFNWTVVPVPPVLLTTPTSPTNASSASFSYRHELTGVTFSCALDDGGYANCPAGAMTYGNLSSGTHTFRVRAQVGSSPPSQPAGHTWTIDRAAPSVTLDFPTNGGIYNPSSWAPPLRGKAADPSGVAAVSVAVRQLSSGRYWNGTAFNAETITYRLASGTTAWELPMGLRPGDGDYSIFARATDSLGNVTPSNSAATSTFTLDSVAPPTPRITNRPAATTTDRSAEFRFTDNERRVTFTCALDGGAAQACGGNGSANEDGQGRMSYANLSAGNHCFSVTAIDRAGNPSAPSPAYCWTVTSTARTIAVWTGSAQSSITGTAYSSALEAKVTGAGGGPVGGVPVTFTAPASGPSGSFSGGCVNPGPPNVCTVLTDTGGIATAAVFTANATPGAFSVVASTPGVAGPATFALTNAAPFSVGGGLGASALLFPGTGQPIELTFTNPNPTPITIPAAPDPRTVIVTISSPSSACPADPNFRIAHGLLAAVTVPANTTVPISLSALGIDPSKWPRLEMVETGQNQDACKNVTLTLTYRSGATG